MFRHHSMCKDKYRILHEVRALDINSVNIYICHLLEKASEKHSRSATGKIYVSHLSNDRKKMFNQ